MATKARVWLVFRYFQDEEDGTFAGVFDNQRDAVKYVKEAADRFAGTGSTFGATSYEIGDTTM